jgi:hypothetical protein
MKQKLWVFVHLIIVFGLAGCTSAVSTVQLTKTEHLPTSMLILTPIPSSTLTPFVTVDQSISPTVAPSITATPLNTLIPEKANETIKALLNNPIDCSAPCFWGITPGQTTIEEARDIFSHFGLQMASTIYNGEKFSGIQYEFESGLWIDVTLEIQDDIVENIQIKITPSVQKGGIGKEWMAYSPETLIKRYGIPSRVDFAADWGPGPFFAMQMYFDEEDLIVQYAGDNIIPGQKGSSQVCPLSAQFDSIWLWMGKNPHDPPGFGVPLETVTSLTLNSFSKLMTGDPENACFIFNGDAINNSRK